MKKLLEKINYDYHNTDGNVVYTKVRTNYTDDTKNYAVIQPDGTRGRKGQPKLLYNLHNVVKADTVYIVEGEKCADALIFLGYVATTLDCGANSKWQPEFTELLKNKTVIILPDNDEPGRKYARNIRKNVPWATVKELPGLEEKEDIFDWLHKGHSISEIDNLPETIYEDTNIDSKEENEYKCSKDKTTQSEVLLNLIEDEEIELFLNEDHEAYIEIPVDGHKELLPLDSSNFSLWAQHLYYQNTGKTIRQENLKQVINILRAKARFGRHPCITLYNRVAKYEDSLWYDLTSQSWNAVKISNDSWSVENKIPKLFCRYRHQHEQVTPQAGGDISKLFEYINISEYRTLFICWLVSCFVPDIPHPMPIFHGEKGAAKSTTCVLLKRLIDPSVLDTLTLVKDERSLIVNLKQHYYLPFDNVSAITNDISDTLCRAITGGALQQRKLCTNADDYIFTFQRCISINGINNVANRADLLDRSILFELERVSADKRRNLQEVYNSFEQDRPYLVGAIFDILSKAMSIYPTVNLTTLPRMADFCQWGYAIAEAIGGQGEKFLQEYKSNQSIQNIEAINANLVAFLIVNFMKFKPEWEGRVSDLFKGLQEEAEKQGINPKTKGIPQAPNNLSRKLKEVKSNLENVGIVFEFDNENNSDGRHLCFYNKNLSPLSSYRVNLGDCLPFSNGDKNSSVPKISLPPDENGDNGDDGDEYDDVEF